ncbi:MAG: RING finger domain-containing protein [Sulfobacillus sp.]
MSIAGKPDEYDSEVNDQVLLQISQEMRSIIERIVRVIHALDGFIYGSFVRYYLSQRLSNFLWVGISFSKMENLLRILQDQFGAAVAEIELHRYVLTVPLPESDPDDIVRLEVSPDSSVRPALDIDLLTFTAKGIGMTSIPPCLQFGASPFSSVMDAINRRRFTVLPVSGDQSFRQLLVEEIAEYETRGWTNASREKLPKYGDIKESIAVGVCSICQLDFLPAEQVHKLCHCRHAFHPDCLLKSYAVSDLCPLCRHDYVLFQ